MWFKRQAQSERANDDATRIRSQLDEATKQERNLIESLSRLIGPAKLGVEGRLQEVAEHRSALQLRLDELELQRLTLERRGNAVADWLTIWSAELERVRELTFPSAAIGCADSESRLPWRSPIRTYPATRSP